MSSFRKILLRSLRRHTGDTYKILIGKPDGMIQLCGTRRTRDNNIQMDLSEMRCKAVYWISLAQERVKCWTLANTVMNLLVS
jgi:hypothetical protein